MPKPRIDIEAAKRFILVMMYQAYASDERMDFSPARIRSHMNVPNNVVNVALGGLEADDLVQETQVARTRTFGGYMNEKTVREWVGSGNYELTSAGRKKVESYTDESYDLLIAKLGDEAAAAVYSASGSISAPSSDKWEPLPIEIGDAGLKPVKEALAEVIELVQDNNGYTSEHPNERAEILSALKGAQLMFEQACQFGYSGFVTFVVWPLERLAKRFPAQTAIGVATTFLWDSIKAWAKERVGVGLDEIFKGLK